MWNLRLELLDERWVDDVDELLGDPLMLRFTRIPEPPPLGFARSWITTYAWGRKDGTREGFAVVNGDGRFVGMGLAPQVDSRAGELELVYIIASDARGRASRARSSAS